MSCSANGLDVGDLCGTSSDSADESCGQNDLCGGEATLCTSNLACLANNCDGGTCTLDLTADNKGHSCASLGIGPYVGYAPHM